MLDCDRSDLPCDQKPELQLTVYRVLCQYYLQIFFIYMSVISNHTFKCPLSAWMSNEGRLKQTRVTLWYEDPMRVHPCALPVPSAGKFANLKGKTGEKYCSVDGNCKQHLSGAHLTTERIHWAVHVAVSGNQ